MKVDIFKVKAHYEAWAGKLFICSGDTYKECEEEVLAMGFIVR